MAGWTFDEYLSTYDKRAYIERMKSGIDAVVAGALRRMTAVWRRRGMSERHIRARQTLFRTELCKRLRALRGRAK